MRAGIEFTVTPDDRLVLEALARDRNAAQKHVARAKVILATADGCGTMEVMRRSGLSKPGVWRWQERFMHQGVHGLLRDKTRPPGKPSLPDETVRRVLDLTLTEPPSEATHWTGRMMAKASGVSLRSVQRIWAAHGLEPHRLRTFSSRAIRSFPRGSRTWSGFMLIHPPMPSCSRWTRRAKSRRSTAPSPAFP